MSPKSTGHLVVERVADGLAEGVAAASIATEAHVQLQVVAALDYLARAGAAATRARKATSRDLRIAVEAAGQLAMLARLAEVRLLQALERRETGAAVVDALVARLPAGRDPRTRRQAASKAARQARARAAG